MKSLFTGLGVWLMFLSSVWAKDVSSDPLFSALARSEDRFEYSQYYQVNENPRSTQTNLLSFSQVRKKLPTPVTPYNRLNHFGTWLRDEQRCFNTRADILKRESTVNVSYTATGCTVKDGQWFDVYTGKTFSQASEIQIDHLVPLKNAYMTGAFEWDYKKRCLYANFLGNKFHLLAVSAKENLRKSDNSPSGYLPPNKAYVCQYLKNWLEVKLIWALRMTPDEAAVIRTKVTEANCNPGDFVMPAGELSEQRRYIADHADLCSSH